MVTDPKDVAELQKALNDTAGKASVLWTTFITFQLYLAIAFGSVTHRDLFLEAPIKLPLLNVDLPLVGFFCPSANTSSTSMSSFSCSGWQPKLSLDFWLVATAAEDRLSLRRNPPHAVLCGSHVSIFGKNDRRCSAANSLAYTREPRPSATVVPPPMAKGSSSVL
jgi:hypothetical protein